MSETLDVKFTKKQFVFRTTISHTIAYSIAGLFALTTMHYKNLWLTDFLKEFMKPIDTPIVSLGPSLQIINGIFMGLILLPISSTLILSKRGFLKIFLLIFGFSLFVPQVPGPGSFEGLIYTKIPFFYHLVCLPECIAYSLLFSLFLYFWNRNSNRIWTISTSILTILVLIMSLLGFLDSLGYLPKH